MTSALLFTEQLLSLEKLEGRTPELATIDLNALITEAGTRSARRILDSEIDFSVQTGDTSVLARGGYILLSEALQNLLDNALENSGSAQKYISIKVTIGPSGRAELIVENDGRVLPAGQGDRIFERFVQGDESQGSGLGLAIIAQIAHMNGGTVALRRAATENIPT